MTVITNTNNTKYVVQGLLITLARFKMWSKHDPHSFSESILRLRQLRKI
jgi:hypothetical protein